MFIDKVIPRDNPKLKKSDRIIVLSPIDGKARNTSGMLDPRLFNGENKLHAVKDPKGTLWSLHYDKGVTPTPLKQRFTSFNDLYKFVEQYYIKRNIKIVNVED